MAKAYVRRVAQLEQALHTEGEVTFVILLGYTAAEAEAVRRELAERGEHVRSVKIGGRREAG